MDCNFYVVKNGADQLGDSATVFSHMQEASFS